MKTTRSFFLTALLLAGCAAPPDNLERAALQASHDGTRESLRSGGSGTAGIDAASRVTARYYWVAKYAATPVQREVATTRARAVVKKMAKRNVKPKSRYIAVTTKRDARAKTSTNVMIFDTQSDSIIGNSVYDLNERPPEGEPVKFETYSASFIAR